MVSVWFIRRRWSISCRRALSVEVCRQFRRQLEELHPALFGQIPASCWRAQWVSDVREAGSGRRALRYLAAYVKKSAFSERRLLGYDEQGRVRLTWRDGKSRQWRVEAIEPLELIRRWLQHVLPKGLMRVRHYGWLSAASTRKFRRVRFLLGMRAWREPEPLCEEPLCCHECRRPLRIVGTIQPARGPPLARLILV